MSHPKEPAPDPQDLARQFNLKEFDALRTEIMDTLKEIRAIERYAVAVSGALWAWLATRPTVNIIAWLLPPLLAMVGYLRNRILYMSVARQGEYIRQIEENVLSHSSGPKGWEHHWEPRADTKLTRFEEALVWVVLGLIGVAGVLVRGHLGAVPPPETPAH